MRAAAFLSLLSMAVALPTSHLVPREVILDQVYNWPAAVGDTVVAATRALQVVVTNIDNTKYELEYFWPTNSRATTLTVSSTSGQQLYTTRAHSENTHDVVALQKTGTQFHVVMEY
ncbi:hypothetical protein NX059_007925 [Plenodomus lindquistii]|nr:hypothetical protein NX059_007925 [Plenodomus lindquistii]